MFLFCTEASLDFKEASEIQQKLPILANKLNKIGGTTGYLEQAGRLPLGTRGQDCRLICPVESACACVLL